MSASRAISAVAALLVGILSGFISRSVHARLPVSVCSNYDLCHPGWLKIGFLHFWPMWPYKVSRTWSKSASWCIRVRCIYDATYTDNKHITTTNPLKVTCALHVHPNISLSDRPIKLRILYNREKRNVQKLLKVPNSERGIALSFPSYAVYAYAKKWSRGASRAGQQDS